ncbi:MAG TPA: NAD(P)-binding domain-containing protein [Candidatus Limnocylindrales bacterium]|nr:NAD(P)-binding domain-containing protein [Candidatus Limnocylindrales bacterium]
MVGTAIVGAGPYGLSLAAHFRRGGIPYRIFGRPMDSWLAHMPKGMMLKSDGFASNISDPDGKFALKDFCAESGIEYADAGVPIRLDTFAAYGLAFRDRMVPELDERLVAGIERLPEGFALRLEDGETVTARRVVLAVGITHFEYVTAELAKLSPEFVSHSFRHHDLEPFRGRSVVVMGGGASATDLAGLLKEAGAEVKLVARQASLTFHTNSMGKPRSLWQRIRHPKSGLGPGLRSRFYATAPNLFRYLPERLRLRIVRTHLGPAGGWFARDKVIGKVPLLLGYTLQSAAIRDAKVHLTLRADDGAACEIVTEHVIAATGYRVEIERLQFLAAEIRSKIKLVDGAPVLSSTFESSIPGLYFAGVAAANSFGPMMRFAFGSRFTARRITQALAKSASRERAPVATSSAVTIAK